MDRVEETNEWLKFSDMDLMTAKHLWETMQPQPLEIICYHCQQAAEKALKAFLVYNCITPPRTHDLNDLRNICRNNDDNFDEIIVSCMRLTDYSVQPRYPMGDEITDGDTVLALQDGEKINEFVKSKVNHPRP